VAKCFYVSEERTASIFRVTVIVPTNTCKPFYINLNNSVTLKIEAVRPSTAAKKLPTVRCKTQKDIIIR
jgi:hypothetical protein